MITTPEHMREAAMSRIDALINAANAAGLDDRKEGLRDAHQAIRAIPIAPTMAHDVIAKDRADWLLDAIACATQNRQFLRGDPEYDKVSGEAILLNGEKAISIAISRAIHPADPLSDPRVKALVELLARAKEELRLIRMKDTGAVYDILLRTEIDAALRAIGGEA